MLNTRPAMRLNISIESNRPINKLTSEECWYLCEYSRDLCLRQWLKGSRYITLYLAEYEQYCPTNCYHIPHQAMLIRFLNKTCIWYIALVKSENSMSYLHDARLSFHSSTSINVMLTGTNIGKHITKPVVMSMSTRDRLIQSMHLSNAITMHMMQN